MHTIFTYIFWNIHECFLKTSFFFIKKMLATKHTLFPVNQYLFETKETTLMRTFFLIFPRYDYTLAREYNWNVKNKLSRGYEETYFFVFREDGMFYNELETRSVDTFFWACFVHFTFANNV